MRKGIDVFGRLKSLFIRWISAKEICAKLGGPLLRSDGTQAGYIDLVQIIGSRLVVQGWTTAPLVKISHAGHTEECVPAIQRSDLGNLASGPRKAMGFAVELPFAGGPMRVEIAEGSKSYCYERLTFELPEIWRRKRRLGVSFCAVLFRLLPQLIFWAVTRSQATRDRIKSKLCLVNSPVTGGLVLHKDPVAEPTKVPITIILPVYNALDLLSECLDRVRAHTDCPWRLIIVEDCSTDPAVRPFLEEWCAEEALQTPGRVALLKHDENQGFIKSVNRALNQAIKYSDHVVLLNSDALVPRGWASRLLEPIVMAKDVASVTPLSNDAEIFTAPVICRRHSLIPGAADKVDRVLRDLNFGRPGFDAPTGVGFCMAMNRAYLSRLPQLDTSFGRGYGEEVDWCQRARRLGGRHVVQPRLFVEHRGGASFGSAQKQALLRKNNKEISTRYPRFDADVQKFIAQDPIRTARLALGLALLAEAAKSQTSLYLAHSWGGGAELYLQDRIKKDLARNQSSIVLRVGGIRRWELELHSPQGVTSGGSNSFETIERLLGPVTALRVIYSCGVGDAHPEELPEFLLRLAAGRPIDVLFHDFFPLSPSYHLLGAAGQFDTVPPSTPLAGAGPDLNIWRRAWGNLLQQADQLFVFSRSSAALVSKAYPDLSSKIRVQPHKLHQDFEPLPSSYKGRGAIAVLGNMNTHKGADVVRDLAALSDKRAGETIVLLGQLDPARNVPAGLIVHGQYDVKDIPKLAQLYGISSWVIPSIWPETFSYTTHEALATGLPVFVFELGAQAEAAMRAENGHVVPLDKPQNRAKMLLDAIRNRGAAAPRRVA